MTSYRIGMNKKRLQIDTILETQMPTQISTLCHIIPWPVWNCEGRTMGKLYRHFVFHVKVKRDSDVEIPSDDEDSELPTHPSTPAPMGRVKQEALTHEGESLGRVWWQIQNKLNPISWYCWCARIRICQGCCRLFVILRSHVLADYDEEGVMWHKFWIFLTSLTVQREFFSRSWTIWKLLKKLKLSSCRSDFGSRHQMHDMMHIEYCALGIW